MKLISATVRNYRVHREVRVDFDPARTVIGGPNESGKSTLIEAIHRALFLKAPVTGEPQRSMVSRMHPGHPEVEVEFEAGGARYHLYKRFSGLNGIARLTDASGQTWLNEDAERTLRQLLGVSEVGGGRGVGDRVRRQWSHLWVWQGTSSEDPCQSTREQNDRLLEELQRRGGAVVMQSELDAQTAAGFADLAARYFVSNGRPRSGSDLDRAVRELADAEASATQAAEALEALRQAMDEYGEAEAVIARSKTSLAEIERELSGVTEALRAVAELREEERSRREDLQRAVDRFEELQKREEDLRTVRSDLEAARTSLEPEQAALTEMERRREAVEFEREEAWKAYQTSMATSQRGRQEAALAAACMARFDLQNRCTELELRCSHLDALRGEIASARRELALLPPIDEQVMERLRALEREAEVANAALAGVAAEIELVATTVGVEVNGQEMQVGAVCTVTEPAEIRLRDVATIRVRPGGGSALVRARERAQQAEASLEAALAASGVTNVPEAAAMWACAQSLQAEIDRAEAALRVLTPDQRDPAEQLEAARNELTAKEAELERLCALMPDVLPPSTREECEIWWQRCEATLRGAEADEAEARLRWEARQEESGSIENECTKLRQMVADLRGRVSELEGQERYLVASYGEDASREEDVREAQRRRDAAEQALQETLARLNDLGAEALESDRQRLERARKETEEKQAAARTARAVALDKLRRQGTNDPYADLSAAQARLALAREHYEVVRRRAEAIRLLDRLFAEEQRALSERLTLPLAQAIESYLHCLFGPHTRVVLGFDESGMTGIGVVRSGECGATGFEDLSEGAREQVAAAVRLAVAELLAAEADRTDADRIDADRADADRTGASRSDAPGREGGASLPVVFDDAFAYSDPDRVRTLQRMLDLAASRGLQIIVLTCNPSDYALLGARHLELKAS